MGKQIQTTSTMGSVPQTSSTQLQPALKDAVSAKVTNHYFSVATNPSLSVPTPPSTFGSKTARNIRMPGASKSIGKKHATIRAMASDNYDATDCMPSDCNPDIPYTES